MSVMVYTDECASDYLFGAVPQFDTSDWTVTTEKPAPQVPPPVWDTRPIDKEACVRATRALCG